MRIPLYKAIEWRGDNVRVKIFPSSKPREAWHIHIPAEYVGFSTSFTYWIQYKDADTSCGVVDVDLVGTNEIEFISD